MAALEDDVRDVGFAVDKKAVHLAQMVLVGRVHVTRAADLDLAFRDTVVDQPELLSVAGVAEACQVGLVVRAREHVLDTDVPVRVVGNGLAQPQVRVLLHRLEPVDLFHRAAERELRRLVAASTSSIGTSRVSGASWSVGRTTKCVTRLLIGSTTTSASSP